MLGAVDRLLDFRNTLRREHERGKLAEFFAQLRFRERLIEVAAMAFACM